MSNKVKVAMIQAEAAADLDTGLDRTGARALEAAADRASLIVFPEAWLPGYPAWLDHCRDTALWNHPPVKRVFARMAENSVAVPGPAPDRLAEVSREASATPAQGISERVELFDFALRSAGDRHSGG